MVGMTDVFEEFVAVVAAGLSGPCDPVSGAGLAGRVHLSRFHFDRVIGAAAGDVAGVLPRGAEWVHFQPPAGLRLPARRKVRGMDVLVRMVEHHVWLASVEDLLFQVREYGGRVVTPIPELRTRHADAGARFVTLVNQLNKTAASTSPSWTPPVNHPGSSPTAA